LWVNADDCATDAPVLGNMQTGKSAPLNNGTTLPCRASKYDLEDQRVDAKAGRGRRGGCPGATRAGVDSSDREQR
jgi:hypothetical protein